MGKQIRFRLILASSSPARRDLLRRAGYAFEIMPSDVDEPTGEGFSDPRSVVEHIAWLKAKAIADRLSGLAHVATPTPTLVLAADTIGWLRGRVIGKPDDEAHARQILQTLMGTEHELWTGVCLWLLPQNVQVAWQEVSRVAMTPLPPRELDAYLASGAWLGCSGAYAIQEEGDDPLVRVVTGTKSNVIGLPMETLERVLAWLQLASAPLVTDERG